MVKIVFHTPQIDVRGSCVALYDYAYYSESLLGATSVVVCPKNPRNELIAILKFTNRFLVYFYQDRDDLEKFLRRERCDIFYNIKYGKIDNLLFTGVKNVVHCVFDLSEPHGDVYTAVSETLAKKFNYHLYVPHMIGLRPSLKKEDMREELGISPTSVVFGRHGGRDTFDIEFVKEIIRQVVRNRKDIYFIFMNTPKFDTHKQLFFLEPTTHLSEKNRFICTCDAMIHAQKMGETFGLSCGEFSVNNKPIITYGGPVWNDHYRKILGDKGIYFRDDKELVYILTTFQPEKYTNKDMNCYREYSPENVMKIFKRVFID